MKKISIVTGQLGRGGQEKQLLLLLKDSEKSSYSITLFNWSGLYDQANLDLMNSLHNVSYQSLEGNSFFKKLKVIVFESRDSRALVCFTSYLNFISFILSLIMRIGFAGAARSTLGSELKRFSGWVNLLLVPRILCNSRTALKELKSRSLFKGHQLLLNRLDISQIPNIQGEMKARSISIGTVNEIKNLDHLIELAIFRRKNDKKFNHIHLGDGPLLDHYRAIVIEKELSDSICFLGQVDNVYDFLKSSNIFLHFSCYEGTPNVVLEALSLGLYVVAIRSGDLAYLINQRTGHISTKWDLRTFDGMIDQFYDSKIGQNNLPEAYRYANDGSYFRNLINLTVKE
ncbi:glycosyltransferase [Akkermansiaceae bacterium]|nr:glycosyltransferase [Akkermansiaceae bacterium]